MPVQMKKKWYAFTCISVGKVCTCISYGLYMHSCTCTCTVKTQLALRLKLLQQCSRAAWHFFHTHSNPSRWPQYSGNCSSIAFLSMWSSLAGKPFSLPAPRGVHLRITATLKRASCPNTAACFPAFLRVVFGNPSNMSSIGRSTALLIIDDGRQFVSFIPSIGNGFGTTCTSARTCIVAQVHVNSHLQAPQI